MVKTVKTIKKTRKSRDDYKIFGGLLDVAKALAKPGIGISYEDIMEILDCSHKKAERIVKFFQKRYEDNFDVFRDPMVPQKKLFRLDNAETLPSDCITEAEMYALNGATKKIRDEAITRPLSSLEYKLTRVLKIRKTEKEMNQMEGVYFNEAVVSGPYIKNKIDDDIIRKLRKAILEHKVITCSYISRSDKKKEKKTIKVSPLGILYGSWNNYLVVLEDDGKTKQKILSNISNVKITNDEFFAGHFSIKEYAEKSFGAYHSENGPFNVVWRVSPAAAEDAMKYIFHPHQRVRQNKDGSLTIRFKGDGFYEMSWYLFRWCGEIVPVAPKELVDTYKDILAKITNSVK